MVCFSCLLVVDVQNDFCTGGNLAVPKGEEVVPVVNRLLPHFDHVFGTQDWHPPNHSSFASQHPNKKPFDSITLGYGEQVLWPDHCVQGTPGASFHPYLETDSFQAVIRKGFRPHIDSYSAFFENDRKTTTGLAGYLNARGIDQLFIAGLATDFCVGYSAIDAAAAGFEVTIIVDACRAISGDQVFDRTKSQIMRQMDKAGVKLISSDEIVR